MRCLVTGYRGFIGSRLYKKLTLLGHDVVGIDIKDGVDVNDMLPQANFDYVFHLAALPRVEFSVLNPAYTMKHNAMATSKILEWSKDHGVKRFIFSSSCAVFGENGFPSSPYGLHKLISEMECRLYSELFKLDTVCLRYYNVFSEDQEYGGSYSTIISAWMEKIRKNEPLRIDGDGEQTRDYVHVKDVCDANIYFAFLKEKVSGACYNIGTNQSISVNDIKRIVEKYHKNLNWVLAPSRAGDPKHIKSDLKETYKFGWKHKIDPIKSIENCFNNINKGEN